MHLPAILQERLSDALSGLTDSPEQYASMIRGTTDPAFGDYQVNCAMPLAKQIDGKNPREIAGEIVDNLKVDDLCQSSDIAGPGFINLKIDDQFLADSLAKLLGDERCLVQPVNAPKNIVVDFSSPNVAKPMHVGHIRSTVIGDSLARILGFLGHNVTTDNHLGDWGTQFGMIIYGYKHFGDPDVVKKNPVPELALLYRKVNQLIDYRKAVASVEPSKQAIAETEILVKQTEAELAATEKPNKKKRKALANLKRRLSSSQDNLAAAQAKIAAVLADPETAKTADQHATIDKDVLAETVKLHEGDEENLTLWKEFLPFCKDEINRIYDRLHVSFDHTLGESFYHSMLADVVDELVDKGLAKKSDGAVCVFLDGYDAPMIIRKQDGAFLYATTDLATLKYREDTFNPDEVLYVVDSRQGEHFQKLFQVAKLIGHDKVHLEHVNFGTVLDENGRPMKTRSGTLIGLEGLLDDAVAGARSVVCDPERLAKMDPPMDQDEQNAIAEAVGIGAIKYADLAHHRTSDYRFSLTKMVSLDGNTSAYIQYSVARTQSILQKVGTDQSAIIDRVAQHSIQFTDPAERTLALMLLKFEEALVNVHNDYAPNQLVDYLFDTAKAYASFNEQCHVMNAETDAIQTTRLALVASTGNVLKKGLSLLGIASVPRM
ncbi:arginine--tRNA ligase [Planctomycetes bacterium K23_9]|uniref:Arginine--tRNA ligase n=1 Tax=Stieleria marina TaxID=1930275 RepID=A0A517NWC0_9BACT|nr:Arginine--tRNA ligase [Planctomycetes bacterium K23_9]